MAEEQEAAAESLDAPPPEEDAAERGPPEADAEAAEEAPREAEEDGEAQEKVEAAEAEEEEEEAPKNGDTEAADREEPQEGDEEAKKQGAASSQRYSGRVKSYNSRKGFGFLELEGYDRDIFVYTTHLIGRIGLIAGEAVEFEIIYDAQRPQARRVKVVASPQKGIMNPEVPAPPQLEEQSTRAPGRGLNRPPQEADIRAAILEAQYRAMERAPKPGEQLLLESSPDWTPGPEQVDVPGVRTRQEEGRIPNDSRVVILPTAIPLPIQDKLVGGKLHGKIESYDPPSQRYAVRVEEGPGPNGDDGEKKTSLLYFKADQMRVEAENADGDDDSKSQANQGASAPRNTMADAKAAMLEKFKPIRDKASDQAAPPKPMGAPFMGPHGNMSASQWLTGAGPPNQMGQQVPPMMHPMQQPYHQPPQMGQHMNPMMQQQLYQQQQQQHQMQMQMQSQQQQQMRQAQAPLIPLQHGEPKPAPPRQNEDKRGASGGLLSMINTQQKAQSKAKVAPQPLIQPQAVQPGQLQPQQLQPHQMNRNAMQQTPMVPPQHPQPGQAHRMPQAPPKAGPPPKQMDAQGPHMNRGGLPGGVNMPTNMAQARAPPPKAGPPAKHGDMRNRNQAAPQDAQGGKEVDEEGGYRGCMWKILDTKQFDNLLVREGLEVSTARVCELQLGEYVKQRTLATKFATGAGGDLVRMGIEPKGWVTVTAKYLNGPTFMERCPDQLGAAKLWEEQERRKGTALPPAPSPVPASAPSQPPMPNLAKPPPAAAAAAELPPSQNRPLPGKRPPLQPPPHHASPDNHAEDPLYSHSGDPWQASAPSRRAAPQASQPPPQQSSSVNDGKRYSREDMLRARPPKRSKNLDIPQGLKWFCTLVTPDFKSEDKRENQCPTQ